MYVSPTQITRPQLCTCICRQHQRTACPHQQWTAHGQRPLIYVLQFSHAWCHDTLQERKVKKCDIVKQKKSPNISITLLKGKSKFHVAPPRSFSRARNFYINKRKLKKKERSIPSILHKEF
jgi:hypothetical protein